MNLITRIYYRLFKSEEEYLKQIEFERCRTYIIKYIEQNISYVRHYNSYKDEEDDASKYGLIFKHYRCNIKQLYNEGYYDGQIHFAALYKYGLYSIIQVNTKNLNVYVYQRHAQYYGEYTWEDKNEEKRNKHYSQYEDKTKVATANNSYHHKSIE